MADPTALDALVAGYLWQRTKSAEAERDAAQARVRRAADMLAVIHRDGGHYLEAHGWDKACADAEARVWALVAALEGVQHNRVCPCYRQAGPCARCVVGYDEVDAALTADDAAPVARERARDAVVAAARAYIAVRDVWQPDAMTEGDVFRALPDQAQREADAETRLRTALDALAAPERGDG